MKKLNKKGDEADMFGFAVKIGIILILGAMMIILYFGHMFPRLWAVTDNFGFTSIGQPAEPGSIKEVTPETQEGKDAKAAFDSIVSNIGQCRSKTGKTGCTCDLVVPMFDQAYVISFRSSTDNSRFFAYVFKGSAGSDALPKTAVLGSKEFNGLNLCTSKDILKSSGELGFLQEGSFNLYRDSSVLKFFHFPSSTFGTDTLQVIGKETQISGKENTLFRLYRYDDSHICLFVGRDGDSYGFGAGLRQGNIDKVTKQVNALADCDSR